MISFNLACSAGHEFEGWFQNSDAFDRQREAGQVACPVCGDSAVAKAPMAPAIGARTAAREARAREVRRALVAARRHVERNFDYVGPAFAEEARKIHHGEVDERAIYGETSDAEARALKDEGVPIARIPWVEQAEN